MAYLEGVPEIVTVMKGMVGGLGKANKKERVKWWSKVLKKDTLFSSFPSDGVPLINIGYGKDITIQELALKIRGIIGFTGKITWDETKPDGTPQKLLDVSRISALGWQPTISLSDGIQDTYSKYSTEMAEV